MSPRTRSALALPLIPDILGLCHDPQVPDTVVGTVPIDVINLLRIGNIRPVIQLPNDSVNAVMRLSNLHAKVAIGGRVTGVPSPVTPTRPRQHTRIRIIGKQIP